MTIIDRREFWEYIPPVLAFGIEMFPFPSHQLVDRQARELASEFHVDTVETAESSGITPSNREKTSPEDQDEKPADRPNNPGKDLAREIVSLCRSSLSISSIAPTFVSIWATVASLKEESWLIGAFFTSAFMALFFVNRFSRHRLRHLDQDYERWVFNSSGSKFVSYWIYVVNTVLCVVLVLHHHSDLLTK